MKWGFGRLRTQIASYYLVMSLVMIGVIGLLLYMSISRIILNDRVDATKMAIKKSSDQIAMYAERLHGLSTLIGENPATKEYLINGRYADELRVLEMVKTTMRTDSFIQSIILVSKDGRILSNEESLNMTVSSNMLKEPWYVEAIESENKPVLTSVRMQDFSMDKDTWVVSISQEITSGNGENLGVLLIDLKYKAIEAFLAELDLGKDGFAYILNTKDEVVYHEDTRYFHDEEKKRNLASVRTRSSGLNEEKSAYMCQHDIRGTDWTLIGLDSLDGLDSLKTELIGIILLGGTILFLVMYLTSSILAKRMTRPLLQLEKAMSQVEKGMFEVQIMNHSYQEIQSLSIHFNQMILEIKRLLRENEEKEKELRKQELSVLHSQINPHFLYNTLDTIVWMAEFNDRERVISITKALAKFFQLSLSGGSERTTIKNELEHVANYLYIQKERYGDQLQYEIVKMEGIEQIQIPKIILQPIVENSIYHGIRESGHPGHIVISVEKVDTFIAFQIKDNGVGFDPAILEDEVKKEGVRLGGVGLKNVEKRLKLMCGESASLQIYSQLGKGTNVKVQIEIKEEDERS